MKPLLAILRPSTAFDQESPVQIGAYCDGQDQVETGTTSEDIDGVNGLLQKNVAIVMMFHGWNKPFPAGFCQLVKSKGAAPHITWMPGDLAKIVDGSSDAYIDAFADAAKAFGPPLFLRFGHEMNGTWYPWGQKPDAYRAAWQRVWTRFKDRGVTNVYWVWAPDVGAHIRHRDPSDPLYIARFYPGDRYVDWLGLDGYNFFDPAKPNGSYWSTIDTIVGAIYYDLLRIDRDKPIMIGEFACGDGDYHWQKDGGFLRAKDVWIQRTFRQLESTYPNVKAFNWFQIKKERNWRIDSRPQDRDAFRDRMRSPYYVSTPDPRPSLPEYKVNFARMKGVTATASGQAAWDQGPDSAKDGLRDLTQWCDTGARDKWLRYDLGAPRRIRQLRLWWDDRNPARAYRIQISPNGVDFWTTVVTAAASVANPSVHNVDLTNIRYIRLYVPQSDADAAVHVMEFETWGNL